MAKKRMEIRIMIPSWNVGNVTGKKLAEVLNNTSIDIACAQETE